MYIYSDFQKVESHDLKDNTSKNINFFCTKIMNSTITNLRNSINKKKEFLTKVDKDQFNHTEVNPRKLAKSNSDFQYNKYDNYRNWVQSIRNSVQPERRKQNNSNSKKKFYHEIHREKPREYAFIDEVVNDRLQDNKLQKKKFSSINNLYDLKNENRGTEEKSRLQNKNEDNKEEVENKFWEYDETIKNRETKVIFRKIFDKKLVNQLKLDGRYEKEIKRDYKKIRFIDDNNLKYVNDKIGKIKKKILFMKGVFDFAFPKMMIQKLRGVKDSESPIKSNQTSEMKTKLNEIERSQSQGLKIVSLSPLKSSKTVKDNKLHTNFQTGFEYFSKITQKRRDMYHKKNLETNSSQKIKVVSPFLISNVTENPILN